jgi:alkylation response protein AidB-like acyl-CoA dehydrogenase
MNLELSEEQKLLQDAVDKFFRQESTSARVRAAEPRGYDEALWAEAAGMSLPMMRVPAAQGGGAMSLFDGLLVAELAGRHLASVPLVECLVAARLLAMAGGDAAGDLLSRIGEGTAIVTIALRPVSGAEPQLVPAGAVADGVICLDGSTLYLVMAEEGPALEAGHALPLARWRLNGSRILLASGDVAVQAYQSAIEEWKLLTAATLGGLARAALEQAAAYACERHAFDRPIGSFQGLAHPLADAVTNVDGGRLALWQAIYAVAKGQDDAAAQVSLACWWMGQAAPKAIVKAMRAFGGYGMTMEYDGQFYFRRARALSLLAGDPRHELAHAGDRLFGYGGPVALPEAGDIGIDFDYGEAAVRAAGEAKAFFDANLTDELRDFAKETLDGYHPEFLRKMAQAGLLYPSWPKSMGGAGRSNIESIAIRGVLAEYDWGFALVDVADLVAKIVMQFGTPEVQSEVLPGIARGEIFCALGYTEPSCGSDVFAAKTKAVRDGDDWVIDGQKMFTSQGHVADYVLLLARTNPDVPKHAGLTLFLVPTRQNGFEVHEVKTISHERTNITYYSGVRVPDRYRIGSVDGGVKAMAAALAIEQGGNAYFAHGLQQVLRHARDWAVDARGKVEAPAADPHVRQVLARVAAHVLVTDALTHRSIWATEAKCGQKSHGPMAKLFGSESWISCTSELMALAAPDSLWRGNEALERIELESRVAIPSTVWGGASEVQRSMIAEDALGLPRTRS